METRAHHILIGLFTAVIVAGALVFALWLDKANRQHQYDLYDVAFEEAVSGLSRGSTVEFNGIRIGEVAALRLDPQNPQRVFARVRIDSSVPVRSDTVARLVPAGITGRSIIRLSSGNEPDSVALSGGDDDADVPVIPAVPSPLSRLLTDSSDIVLNANDLLLQAQALFSSDNVQAISRTLRNIEQASEAIAGEREEIHAILAGMTLATEQAHAVMGEAATLIQATHSLIDDRAAQTLRQAERSMQAFEQAMLALDELIDDNRGELNSTVKGLAEVGPVLTQLRELLDSMHTITRQLEDAPADYLLGREPVREFQP